MDEDTLLNLGAYSPPARNKPKINCGMNIFGGKPIYKPLYTETDYFFENIYSYYRNKGFVPTILSKCFEILSLLLGIGVILMLFVLLDWEEYKKCSKIMCTDLFITYTPPSVFCVLILIVSGLFTGWKMIRFIYDYHILCTMSAFYVNVLDISPALLQTISWVEVLNRLSQSQNISVSIQDITSRIMRKDNYYIALFHKNILRFPNRFYTYQLELNLKYIILYDIPDPVAINMRIMKRRFVICGIVNLLLSPFILVYLILYFVACNIDDFYLKKTTGRRKYNRISSWKFRHFNELDHFFKERMRKSVRYADKYISQFPTPITDEICKFISLVSGGAIGILLFISLVDDGFLLNVHVFNRSLLFYIGVLGAISSMSRSVLESRDNKVHRPDAVMELLYKHTQYMPPNWINKCDTYEVRDEFLGIYIHQFVLFVYDVISVFTTPMYLLFIMPNICHEIVNFMKLYSSVQNDIGNVCSFSLFESEYKDNRIERSIAGFNENHFLS
jgi:autophagy-related protein 9